MSELTLIETLDFDELHLVPPDADRVVAGVGEDWPQFRVFALVPKLGGIFPPSAPTR